MVSRLLGRLPWLDIMYQNQAEGEEENTYYRTSLRAHASPSTTFRGGRWTEKSSLHDHSLLSESYGVFLRALPADS